MDKACPFLFFKWGFGLFHPGAGFWGEHGPNPSPSPLSAFLFPLSCDTMSSSASSKSTAKPKKIRAVKSPKDPRRRCAPASVAYVGDSVYEMHCRTVMCNHGAKLTPASLHEQTRRLVTAEAQASALRAIEGMSWLTPDENDVARWGANGSVGALPRRLRGKDGVATYRKATGFEAVVGWLHLTEQYERRDAFMQAAIDHLVSDEDL